MITFKSVLLTSSLIFIPFNFALSEQKNEPSTALGSALGATAGSLIGYQFGNGHGKYATSALGAVGGYIIGGKIQENLNHNDPQYHPEYSYQSNPDRVIYIEQDDYQIKQQLSNDRKRRNMIRNGESDPLEMPYDASDAQTSWDDPNN